MQENRFNPVGAIVVFFLLLFVFSKWGPAIPFSTTTQNKGEPMIVTGEGKAAAIPDIAKVSFGVQESGQTLAQVQDSVNKKSQSLVAALKKVGVEDKDIKTTSYNIYPQSDYQSNPPKITGYQVSINYEVTIRKIESVNEALTTVVSSGANLVGGVSFELSDDAKEQALDEARKSAVSEARKNAESLAKSAGVTLGKIINISENQALAPRPVQLTAKAEGGEQMIATQPDIQPGTTEIDLIVSLSYEIR